MPHVAVESSLTISSVHMVEGDGIPVRFCAKLLCSDLIKCWIVSKRDSYRGSGSLKALFCRVWGFPLPCSVWLLYLAMGHDTLIYLCQWLTHLLAKTATCTSDPSFGQQQWK